VERWEFVSKRLCGPDYSAWEWEWRCVSHEGRVTTSEGTFKTFTACVADARKHGFNGNAEPGGSVRMGPSLRAAWF
jgi:hypothetical protein